jgi:hypothetical protein
MITGRTKSGGVSFDFTLASADGNKTANIHVSIDETRIDNEQGFSMANAIKVEVDLGPLPDVSDGLDGHEVIVDFTLANFDNNQTFWTDSNGLAMQKRVLNYRPTWDIYKNYADANQNITANYYPVTSAMLMQDVKMQREFLVLNDRSQAASALTKGGF